MTLLNPLSFLFLLLLNLFADFKLFEPSQGPVCDEDLAPKHFERDWGHLSRYFEGPMGRGHDTQNRLAFAAGIILHKA